MRANIMENIQDLPRDIQTTTKKEEMSQDIIELENLIISEKDKLRIAENDEKLEDHIKNFLEVRKDELNQNIEFYKIHAKRMRNKLAQRLAIHSKFSMAEQCYDKLLKTYEENYLQDESRMQTCNGTSMTHKHILDFQKQAEQLQKQIDHLKERIDENTFVISDLLGSLQFPIE